MSFYQPVSLSWWRWHYTHLHRGQRDTRLSPYLINCTTLYLLTLPQLQEYSVLIPLRYSSSPSSSAFSAFAATVSLAPTSSTSSCYHHQIPTCAHRFLSTASHRYRIGRIAIYCTNLLRLFWMYVSIGSNPASSLAASAKVYSHLPSDLRHGIHPISCCTTWSWNSHRTCTMRGVTHYLFFLVWCAK